MWIRDGGVGGGHFNIVPVDFVADALDHIAHQEEGNGQCFHLTADRSYNLGEVMDIIASAAQAPRMPVRIDQRMFDAVPGVVRRGVSAMPPRLLINQARENLDIRPPLIKFLTFPTEYDNRRAAAALAVAVACAPALAEERTDPRGWNASAMGVYVIEDSDRFDVDYGAGIRFGLGRQISEKWDLEWNGFGNSLQRNRGSGQHWQYGVGADALRYMYREGPSPYLLVGGGGVYTDSTAGTDTNGYLNAGAGLHFREIWGSMGLRAELRYVMDFSDDGSHNEPFGDVRALVGLTFPLFGGGDYGNTRIIERERLVIKPVPMGPPEVLHGVHFEFDSARLTPNAQTWLL